VRQFFAKLLVLTSLFGVANAETALQLSLPLACTPEKDCFIQQYVDVQPGPGEKDYRCGIATYDGHDGTDFRLLSVKAAEAGVAVKAAAAGRVTGLRDGVDDRLVATPQDRARIKDRECGNGVLIDHGAGWETQYCHLRRGSLTVHKGDMVAAGALLGLVGFSGDAQFAHVHLSVRHNGETVDPFLGEAISGACLASDTYPPHSLWAPAVRGQLIYRDAVIIETGFAGKPVAPDEAEQGGIAEPLADSPALVFFARIINMRAGDRLRLKAEGPGGYQSGSESEPMSRAKANYVGFTGKKRTGERWPAGLYQGAVEVIRDGAVVSEAKAVLRLP
jgi:Peptidase family M23